MSDELDGEPWEWSEDQWRGVVDQVRAGRSLKPDHWPNGARVAVALSFDSDHSTRRQNGICKCEFDGAYRERGTFVLTLHPHVIGHRSRISVVEALIEYITGHDDVWFATHEAIVRHCLEADQAT